MKKSITRENHLFILAVIFIAFSALWAVFYNLFKDEQIYNAVLSKYIKNYENVEGTISHQRIPYQSFSEKKLCYWDAGIYYKLKNSLYHDENDDDGYFAFFPFFPVLWHFTDFLPSQLIIVHSILYFISLLFFLNAMYGKIPIKEFILMLCMPMAVLFYMPYTEAYYMLFSSIAVWGLIKRKPAVYLIAMFLASTCRPVGTLLIIAIVCAEVYWFLNHRNLKKAFYHFLFLSIPMIAGTLFSAGFQMLRGAESLFTFIDVQKYWNHYFEIPTHIADWSSEQEGSNKFLFFVLTPILIIYIVWTFVLKLKTKTVASQNMPDAKSFLFTMSSAYVIGIILFSLFYQQGNLHGSSRYILCTPFFWLTALQLPQKIKQIISGKTNLIFKISLMTLPVIGWYYYKGIGFNYFSFYLLYFVVIAPFFRKQLSIIFYGCFFIISALWLSYLFNCHLADAWMYI